MYEEFLTPKGFENVFVSNKVTERLKFLHLHIYKVSRTITLKVVIVILCLYGHPET